MKKLILLGCFALANVGVQAQSFPWLQIGNEWTYDLYLGWNPLHGLHRIVIDKEVVLDNNVSWMRFRRNHVQGGNNLFYYARQEGDKIYTRDLSGQSICIYDFAMLPGDTLFFTPSLGYYAVLDTGSAFIAGRVRRTQTIQLSNWGYQNPLLVVEGIGPVSNPQDPNNQYVCSFFFLNMHFCHAAVDGMSAYFKCFSDIDGIYAPFDACLVSTDEAEAPVPIRVWPNPTSERLFVQGAFHAYQMFDAVGRLVLSQSGTAGDVTEIPTTHLPNGVYFLHGQTDVGEHSPAYKVVVAH